jgi:hypothetical protein
LVVTELSLSEIVVGPAVSVSVVVIVIEAEVKPFGIGAVFAEAAFVVEVGSLPTVSAEVTVGFALVATDFGSEVGVAERALVSLN